MIDQESVMGNVLTFLACPANISGLEGRREKLQRNQLLSLRECCFTLSTRYFSYLLGNLERSWLEIIIMTTRSTALLSRDPVKLMLAFLALAQVACWSSAAGVLPCSLSSVSLSSPLVGPINTSCSTVAYIDVNITGPTSLILNISGSLIGNPSVTTFNFSFIRCRFTAGAIFVIGGNISTSSFRILDVSAVTVTVDGLVASDGSLVIIGRFLPRATSILLQNMSLSSTTSAADAQVAAAADVSSAASGTTLILLIQLTLANQSSLIVLSSNMSLGVVGSVVTISSGLVIENNSSVLMERTNMSNTFELSYLPVIRIAFGSRWLVSRGSSIVWRAVNVEAANDTISVMNFASGNIVVEQWSSMSWIGCNFGISSLGFATFSGSAFVFNQTVMTVTLGSSIAFSQCNLSRNTPFLITESSLLLDDHSSFAISESSLFSESGSAFIFTNSSMVVRGFSLWLIKEILFSSYAGWYLEFSGTSQIHVVKSSEWVVRDCVGDNDTREG